MTQEDDLIKKSVSKERELKWKKIMTNIKEVDPSFNRSSKQIR